jgi:ribonuclease HI
MIGFLSMNTHLASRVIIHTDGGSRNNPGDAGIGATIDHDGIRIADISEFIGTQTNNFAEYMAVIRALEQCIELWLTGEALAFKLDSKLVVEQVQGNWKIKEPTLRPLVERVRELVARFPHVSFTHIPRAHNKDADALVNEAIDRGQGL